MEEKKTGSLAGFLIPSIIGIFLFMIPVQSEGKWTVVVKIIADVISAAIGDYLPILCLAIVTISALLGIIFLQKPNFIATYPIVANTFSTTAVWVIIRIIGAIFIWLTYLGIDAEDGNEGVIHMITCADGGGFVLNDLLSVLVVIFLLAGLLLPLLLDFGLLEFIALYPVAQLSTV